MAGIKGYHSQFWAGIEGYRSQVLAAIGVNGGCLRAFGLRLLELEPSKRSVRVIWLPSSGCTEDLAAHHWVMLVRYPLVVLSRVITLSSGQEQLADGSF